MNAGVPGRVQLKPNRNTAGLLALLVAIWYASASQNNGAAYLFAFIIVGVSAVSVLHTLANLRGVRIECGAVRPVFAGEEQCAPIRVFAGTGTRHFAIRVCERGGKAGCHIDDIAGAEPARADLLLKALERGCVGKVELEIHSQYPLGLFTASRPITVWQARWIYPKAAGIRPPPAAPASARSRGVGTERDGDDFSGLRAYVPGEPQRHIDWKAVARGRDLMVKEWGGEMGDALRFQWADTAGLAHEARLSQLAAWVVLAERLGRGYALTMPGAAVPIGRGPAHFHECLRALAAFPKEGVAA